jgi:hypothetical protein
MRISRSCISKRSAAACHVRSFVGGQFESFRHLPSLDLTMLRRWIRIRSPSSHRQRLLLVDLERSPQSMRASPSAFFGYFLHGMSASAGGFFTRGMDGLGFGFRAWITAGQIFTIHKGILPKPSDNRHTTFSRMSSRMSVKANILHGSHS